MVFSDIVGFLQITFIPYLAYQGRWRALVEGVRVNKKYRGQGIGKRLFVWAIHTFAKVWMAAIYLPISILDLASFHVLQDSPLVINLPECRYNIRVELGTDTFIYNF